MYIYFYQTVVFIPDAVYNSVFRKWLQHQWRYQRVFFVNTGIHFKGWTRQQTLDYMYENSPAEPTRAISEAERFAAIPGQALAYKIGQLKIIELRQRAEKALGKKFDVRKFHDEVLKDGAMPLEVLEAKIDRWIAASR